MNVEDNYYLGHAAETAGYTGSDRMEGWQWKANKNVDKWELQSIPRLLLAVQEEVGEIGEELEHYLSTDEPKLVFATQRTVEVGEEVQDILESMFEDEDGKPVEDPPTFELNDSADLDRIEEELEDTAALLIQLQAAIEKGKAE